MPADSGDSRQPVWDDPTVGGPAGRGDRVRVIVELAGDAAGDERVRAAAMAAERSIESFTLDQGYGEVDLPSRGEGREALRGAAPRARLVRGAIAESDLEVLRGQPGVVAVYRDAPIAPFAAPALAEPRLSVDCDTAVAKGSLADVAQVLQVDRVWARGWRGAGITIGIVDGGVTAAGRARRGEPPGLGHVTGGWPEADWGTQASAWSGHGNMTATDALGMAPEAELFDIRIAGSQSFVSTAVLAYRWAIDTYRGSGRPQVLSNSWGIYQASWELDYAEDPDHPFTRIVVEAMDAGMLVLFAAGNCGARCASGRCGSDVGPGRSIWGANGHPRVICVGAANVHGALVGYSSEGPSSLGGDKPDIYSISHFRGYQAVDTGTSAACPVAAGVVALLRQAQPRLRQDAARAALRDTAQSVGSASPVPAGPRMIRALDALGHVAPDPAPRPSVWHRLTSAPCLYGVAAASTRAGIELLAVGADSRLYHRGPADAGFSRLDASAVGRPALAASADGALHAFTIAPDRRAYASVRRGGAWGAWQAIGGCCLHGLAAVCAPSSEPTLFAVGLDGRLYATSRAGSAWSPWRSLSGTCMGSPAAVALPGRGAMVFAIGPDSSLYARDAVAAGATWHSLGGRWLHGPAAVATDGGLTLYGIGLDGAMRSLRRVRDAWSAGADVGGVCLSAAAAARGDGITRVFVIGEGGALWEREIEEKAELAAQRQTVQGGVS